MKQRISMITRDLIRFEVLTEVKNSSDFRDKFKARWVIHPEIQGGGKARKRRFVKK